MNFTETNNSRFSCQRILKFQQTNPVLMVFSSKFAVIIRQAICKNNEMFVKYFGFLA